MLLSRFIGRRKPAPAERGDPVELMAVPRDK